MTGSPSLLLFLGAFFVCTAEILHIIGLATPFWVKFDRFETTSGIFKTCSIGGCQDLDIDNIQDLRAVRAMTILGAIFGFISMVMAIRTFTMKFLMCKEFGRWMRVVCFVSSLAAFVFMTIGLIMFDVTIYRDKMENGTYHVSFAVCMVAVILMPIGGFMIMLGGKETPKDSIKW